MFRLSEICNTAKPVQLSAFIHKAAVQDRLPQAGQQVKNVLPRAYARGYKAYLSLPLLHHSMYLD